MKSIECMQKWIQDKHTCEKCGKVMAEYYGTGRFCSRSCANTRAHSDETKKKIGKSCSEYLLKLHVKECNSKKYNESPSHCKICGEILDYEKRNSNICSSKECYSKWMSICMRGKTGGIRPGAGNCHKGTYKGHKCDSTYELVYVIYNLDHGIKFSRNNVAYVYADDYGIHDYFPDFVLEDGTLIEIKGRIREDVYPKIRGIDDAPIKLLCKQDLDYAFEYVKNTYSYKSLKDLYD